MRDEYAAYAQADALGAALARLGLSTEVLRTHGHEQFPCVVVTSGPARVLEHTEYLYAAPDDEDGSWWFWRVSSRDPLDFDRIAPLSDVSVTADRFARTSARARVPFSQAE